MSPIALGAGLACALGGAVAGNALGSTPIINRSMIETFYQEHEDSAYEAVSHDDPPPDHYPLITHAGTVPVAELGMRGLYSQARYRALNYAYGYAPDYEPAEFAVADYSPEDAGSGYESEDNSVRIGDAEPNLARASQDVESEPEAPLQLAAGPADVAA